MVIVQLLSHVRLFCNPVDCSLPDSSVLVISQARIPEWFAISFSRGSSRPRDGTCVFCIAGRFSTSEPPAKSCHVSLEATILDDTVMGRLALRSSLAITGISLGLELSLNCHLSFTIRGWASFWSTIKESWGDFIQPLHGEPWSLWNCGLSSLKTHSLVPLSPHGHQSHLSVWQLWF